MSVLVIPAQSRCSDEAIHKLVDAGRRRFTADLREDVSAFDTLFWDLSALKDRSTNGANRTVYFTRHGTTDQALPPLYASVVKSWILLDRGSTANMINRMMGVRILWEAILLRHKDASKTFRWEMLTEEDLSHAELLAWKIHDFRNTEGLAMVQIRCLGGFETKNEAFA
jgi:hypothetical protein